MTRARPTRFILRPATLAGLLRPALVGLSGLLALVLASCGGGPERRPVVLIVVDTLRADHMTAYGYERPTTPRLDELGRDGAIFEQAFSAAAWTLPGVGSILTGQWPAVHGGGVDGANEFNRLREEIPTLAELLSSAGYRTGAVVNGGYLHEEFGMARGFDRYDFRRGADDDIRRADASVDLALAWIDERPDEPFFLLLHLFDVHRHYDAPEPARGTFTDVFAERYGEAAMATLESRRAAEEAGDLEFHVAAYDEEILWVDSQLGRFFDQLGQRGLRETALLVLTSDHGEAFREHGPLAHGNNLYNEVLRVPWMAWGPGIVPGARTGPVATVDVLPTVLEFAEVELPPVGGVSLWPLLRDPGASMPPRQIFAQNNMYGTDLTVVIDWPLKLLQDFRHTTTELFDLESDPAELVNLADTADGSMMRRLRALRRDARALRESSVGGTVELSEEMRQELRSLGYIQ